MPSPKCIRLLIINPNSTVSITEGFKPLVSSLALPNTSISYWTSPSGPAIIRNQADNYESAVQSLEPLLEIIDNYDGFLIACYADHFLTPLLQSYVGRKPVIGIFDASVTTAMHLVDPGSKFAILTTGSIYEALLTEGVRRILGNTGKGAKTSSLFGGVAATGINVDELGVEPPTEVRSKMMDATRRLVKAGDVSVLCIGGVILAGMEDWVREACVLELGLDKGQNIKVVDQMLAGVMTLEGLVRIGT